MSQGGHLIVVCCHAIWLGGETLGDADSEWAMEEFQAGEGPTFKRHIHLAVDALLDDPAATLMFSGAATKLARTSVTEADSYKALALSLRGDDLKGRDVKAEPYATNSFQNLLFSLLLYWRETKTVPSMVTVVSHQFKQQRFTDLHRPTIKWPPERFRFLGADPPKDRAGRDLIQAGEARALGNWRADPFGAWGKLREQRQQRGFVVPEHIDRVSRLAMEWSGGVSGVDPFPHGYPWDEGGLRRWEQLMVENGDGVEGNS